MKRKDLKILNDIYEIMPNQFRSHFFNFKCIELGLSSNLSKSGQVNKWLIRRTTKISRYEYLKNEILIEKDIVIEKDLTLDNAIKIVKQHGYKIMKQVTDWQEL